MKKFTHAIAESARIAISRRNGILNKRMLDIFFTLNSPRKIILLSKLVR